MDQEYMRAVMAGARQTAGQQGIARMVDGQMVLPQAPKKKRGLVASLLPAAGAIGAGLLAAPLTGGLSLAGTIAALGAAGAAGGAVGELGAQKNAGEKFNLGAIAKEGALSGAFGAGGAALSGVRGLRAAKTVGMVGDDAAKAAADVARGTLKVKDITRGGASGALAASEALQARGLGAFNPKEGLRAISNAAERVATANEYGIKSGYKGLRQATAQMDVFEKQLTQLLTKTRIPAKDVIASLDDVARSTTTGLSDDALNRIIEAQKQNIVRQAKGGYISGDKLRKLRAQVGNGIFKGAESDRKVLLKDIYSGLGDTIGTASPKAREILSKQHGLLDLGEGLAKKSVDARIPIPMTGFGVKVPGAGAARDRVIDTLAGALGKVGNFTRSGATAQAARQLVPRAVMGGASMSNRQPDDQASYGENGPMEAPTSFYDNATGALQGLEAPLEQPVQSAYSREAVMADIQRDPKNMATYIKLYEFANPEGGTKPLNATAAGNVTDLQNGIANIGQLKGEYSRSSANNPLTAWFRGKNPYDTEAQDLQANTARIKQVIGKALEGGVLRKEDEAKYAKILPKLSDTDAVAQRKIAFLEEDLNRKLSLYMSNLGRGGGGAGLEDTLMQLQGSYY